MKALSISGYWLPRVLFLGCDLMTGVMEVVKIDHWLIKYSFYIRMPQKGNGHESAEIWMGEKTDFSPIQKYNLFLNSKRICKI